MTPSFSLSYVKLSQTPAPVLDLAISPILSDKWHWKPKPKHQAALRLHQPIIVNEPIPLPFV
jgi:hypothetical protein